MKTYLFDLDGTLTLSKQPIDEEMASLLRTLTLNCRVGIVTGGKYEQIRDQVLAHLPTNTDWGHMVLFPVNAAAMYYLQPKPVLVYCHTLDSLQLDRITNALKAAALGFDVPWDGSYGTVIEFRGSQVTFSALGQNAPLDKKKLWDPDRKKRISIAQTVEEALPEFQASVGGTTSVDVTLKGVDKTLSITSLTKLGIPLESITYVGDALFEGGNDYVVVQTGVSTHSVKDVEDTKSFIRTIMSTLQREGKLVI